MRCPDCNKFVPQEVGDIEVSVDVTDDRSDKDKDTTVTVTGDVRVPINCAECGTELKSGDFTIEEEVEIEGHHGDEHTLEAEETNTEAIERQDGKPGTASRYRRTFYGASVTIEVRCSCGQPTGKDGQNVDVGWSDDMQASSFDEVC